MSSRSSSWNTYAPLIAGLLIVGILFAWVFLKKRTVDAEKHNQQMEAQRLENEKIEREAEEARKAEHQRRLDIAREMNAKIAAQREAEANRLWNWVRQKETVVRQSATREPYNALAAADGNKDGKLENGSVIFALPTLNREKKKKTPAWWMADFGKERRITEIMLYNSTDPELKKRLSNFNITILDKNKKPVYDLNFFTEPGEFAKAITKIEVPDGTFGRWFRIKLNGPNALGDGALNIAEIEVLGPPPEKE